MQGGMIYQQGGMPYHPGDPYGAPPGGRVLQGRPPIDNINLNGDSSVQELRPNRPAPYTPMRNFNSNNPSGEGRNALPSEARLNAGPQRENVPPQHQTAKQQQEADDDIDQW